MYNQPVTFKQATDQIASRMDTPTAMKYTQLTAAWDDQFRRRAFFSARVAEADLLGELHKKAQAVAEGRMSKDQARRLIREYFVGDGADALARLGFAPPKDARGIAQLGSVPRLELILDTNVRMAQETGHYKKWETLKDVYPYGVWRVGYSKVHREAHLERDGKVYAFDHPIWRESPPGGEFNCHCRRGLMTADELAASGLRPVPKTEPFQKSSLGFDPGADEWGDVPFGKTVPEDVKKVAEEKLSEDLERMEAERDFAKMEKEQMERDRVNMEEVARQAQEEAERLQREMEARIEAERIAEEERRKAEHASMRQKQLEAARANRSKREKKLKADITKNDKQLEAELITNGKASEAVAGLLARRAELERTKAHYAREKFAGFDAAAFLDAFIKKIDDKLSKAVKTADTKYKKAKKEAEKLGTYPGIWFMQAPTPADYADKKDSIPAKLEYYKTHPGNDAKIKELLEFEANGKLHEASIQSAKTAFTDATEKLASFRVNNYDNPFTGAYTQARKDGAKWFTDANGGFGAANRYFDTSDTYDKATSSQKRAAVEYTAGSGKFNRPLSGFRGSWGNYVGIGKVPLNEEGGGEAIGHLTNLIANSNYKDDVWVNRGDSDLSPYNSFLGERLSLSMDESELKRRMVGREFVNYAFLSTGVNKGGGFGGAVVTNVYLPAGTPCLYCEPFSRFKGAGENELLVQRGMSYKIIKVKKNNGRIYIDIEAHPEKGLTDPKDKK